MLQFTSSGDRLFVCILAGSGGPLDVLQSVHAALCALDKHARTGKKKTEQTFNGLELKRIIKTY